jgi:hypothetical protein
VRLDRAAVVDRGKKDEAMTFAAEVTAHVKDNWGIDIIWGMEVGGTFGKVNWFSDYDNMAHLEETFGRTMTDEGYRSLLEKAADVFFPNATQDTLVYTM